MEQQRLKKKRSKRLNRLKKKRLKSRLKSRFGKILKSSRLNPISKIEEDEMSTTSCRKEEKKN